MSVRSGDREEGKLQVLNDSMELCRYTLTICRNEKIFPKSQRWMLTQKIVNTVLDVVACIREANATSLTTGENADIEYRYRRSKQIEAHALLNSLMTLITVAYEMMNVDGRRVQHWTELVVNTDRRLKAWMKSDKERYEKKS